MITDTLIDQIELSRADTNAFPIPYKMLKLTEEHGELAEALLAEDGFIAPNKMDKVGTVDEEAADMLGIVVDIMQAHHPELSPREVVDLLELELQKKNAKWSAQISERSERLGS